ncbi:type II toxin-antitoxin system PemK/MazF family toxin [Granulicatella seriolae]
MKVELKRMKNNQDSPERIRRGDVYVADLSPVIGSEQGGKRPVLIIQNDIGNYYSPTVIIAAITAKSEKTDLPTHIEIKENQFNFNRASVILLEQVRTIDKSRLLERITHIEEDVMTKVDEALAISLGLN